MSVFSRLTDVINANLHSLLDKSEEPEKMLRLMIEEMEQVQVEMRTQAARVIAEQKQLERHQQALRHQIQEWSAKAELARPEPNFERLLNMREEFSELSANERKVAISEWVRFTQMLTAEQKALVKGQLLDRVSRAENLREKFRQRHGG